MKLMWVRVDRGKNVGTGAYNLKRTPISRDGMSAHMYEALQHSPQDDKTLAEIFLNGLRWGVGRLELQMDKKPPTLTFNKPEAVEFKRFEKPPAEIKDENFFNHIIKMLNAVKREKKSNKSTGFIAEVEDDIINKIEDLCRRTPRTITHIYYELARLNEVLFARAVFTCPPTDYDGFGSESDDQLPSKNTKRHVYTRKLTVQNGMRSILASLHAGANYLFPNYTRKVIGKKPALFLYGAYFETADAVKLMAKFEQVTDINKIGDTKILIYDINACETSGGDEKDILQTQKLIDKALTSIKVMIIDVTSSTSAQQNEWIKKFQHFPNAKILFLVLSGLKNQQGGADKNPYGTIRIFTKGKKGKALLTKLVSDIRRVEKPVQSKVAHHFRRLHKRLGNVPSATDILHFQRKKRWQKRKENEEEQVNVPSRGSRMAGLPPPSHSSTPTTPSPSKSLSSSNIHRALRESVLEHDTQKTALLTQRIINKAEVKGDICDSITVEIDPDGNCGFNATATALRIAGEEKLSQATTRAGFIASVREAMNELRDPGISQERLDILTVLIKKIFQHAKPSLTQITPENFAEWLAFFNKSGYWASTIHFEFMSYYHQLRFEFYVVDHVRNDKLILRPGDEGIIDRNGSVLTIRLLHNSAGAVNIEAVEPNNHFDLLYFNATDVLKNKISEKGYLITQKRQNLQAIPSVNQLSFSTRHGTSSLWQNSNRQRNMKAASSSNFSSSSTSQFRFGGNNQGSS